MEEAILVGLRPAVHAHPWWQARARLVGRMLTRSGLTRGRVLDAGCGWGVTTLALEKLGYEVACLDVSIGSLEALDDGRRRLIRADLTSRSSIGAPEFDAVLALDVIEHLEDDARALANLAGLVVPGGLLVVTVPARPELYSEFDASQGHRRRYTKESLARSLQSAGISGAEISWWGGWMVPLLKTRARRPAPAAGSAAETYRHHLRVPPWPFSAVLRAAFFLDEYLTLARLNPTGTSLVATARI